MKDNFANVPTLSDDDTIKNATDNLNAEFEREGIVDHSLSEFGNNGGEDNEAEDNAEEIKQEQNFEVRPKRNGEQRRLKKQLDQQAQLLAYKEAELERMRQQVGDSQYQTIETAKHALEVKRYTIKEKLQEAYKRAQQTDDYSEVTELQDLLSEVSSEYNQLKKQKPVEEVPYHPQYEPVYNQEQADNPFEEWLEENPWYDRDPELRAEADAIYRDWKKRLVLNNREDLLETFEFYDEIGKTVKSKYGFKENAPAKRGKTELPQYGGASHLNGAYNGGGGKEEPLTQFEKELAHTMPKPGLTNKQKEDLYRKNKYSN